MNGETFAGWSVITRSPRGSIDVLFGPVVTHPAFSGAGAASNNTAEMTAMIEALYCLGPRGSVARQDETCVFYDSKHAAEICLGTIQASTHIQHALACQRSTLCVQHRLRLTMQHVYGHAGNLGNECADHAAALGSLGFISSHNDAARWDRHNFDINTLCDGCNGIREILERLDHARTEATVRMQDVTWFNGLSSELLWSSPLLLNCCGFDPSLFCVHSDLLESDGESKLVCLYSVELGWKLRTQYVGSFVGFPFFMYRLMMYSSPFNDGIDLARIALSCRFALELLCFKELVSLPVTIA